MNEKSQMQKELYNAKLLSEGRLLEYQYVNELKDRRINQLQQENEKIKNEKKQLEEKNEEIMTENSNLVKKMQEEVNKYKESTSWKITKPLRKIVEIYRKIGGKNG